MRSTAYAVVVLLAVAIGSAWAYRGMHHPTDVFFGALMGLTALSVTVLAVRVTALDGSGPPPRTGRCAGAARGRAGAGGVGMTTVAVVAHTRKQLGGGLTELREALAAHGIDDPLWHEVSKSKQAPKQCRLALEAGADLVFVWGGDGMVQRCADVLAGTGAAMAVVPAGTANLLADEPRDPQGRRAAPCASASADTAGISTWVGSTVSASS